MSIPRRVFMDVSYTRTQTGNVGITRTVRRLMHELAASVDAAPVVFHRAGFRHVPPGVAQGAAADGGQRRSRAAALFRWVSQGAVRRLVSMLPSRLLRWAWGLSSVRMFNAMSSHEQPVDFGKGDWLILADESWNYPAWDAAAAARKQGAFVVLVVYDLIPLRHPEFCAPLFSGVFRSWLARMLHNCDAVACISGATRHDLLEWAAAEGLQVPPSAHFRLGSDIPNQHAGPVREDVARFMDAHTPFFAAIGTIEPRKNHALLLEVFEALWRDGVPVRLFVAGRANAQSRAIAERMRRHPQQGRLLMTLLDASDAEVTLAYERCRALVFPSLAEGFGLPLVEARSRNCPVIASDLPALREIADAGVSFFPPDDVQALGVLLREHLRSERLKPVAQIPIFTWQRSAMDLMDVIETLA